MNDIKDNIAKNITKLRLLHKMTQLELGEKLNYSDKTISKWERAESSPDISALIEMAELFGVTLDCIVKSENVEKADALEKTNQSKYNRRMISYISESVAVAVAVFAFIITTLILNRMEFQWLYFVYALPIVLIVKLIFNSIWFNPRHNYLIISALMWSILAAIHITFMYFGVDVALIYVMGIMGQTIIALWSRISKPK